MQARVDELRSAILAGNAEAEGLDATNPERRLLGLQLYRLGMHCSLRLSVRMWHVPR